ncbi:hypothetical protein AB0G02_08500, partial [Actinosynnema sp. NPDC023658]
MTSVPPSRRRPVPTTPTTRPRVAGLRNRPEQGATPADAPDVRPTDADARVTDAPPAAVEPAAEPVTSEPTTAGATAAQRTTEPTGSEPADAGADTAEPVDESAEPGSDDA